MRREAQEDGANMEPEDEGPFEFRVDLSLMQTPAKAEPWSQRFSQVPVFDPSQVISLAEYRRGREANQ